jgi:diguanylate cyclase (GGDEF)-like protein
VILQNLSVQLLTQTRSSDIVCRYGGEEFLLVLPNTTTEAAQQSAERWREEFQDSKISWKGAEIQTTLSLGVATFPADGATSKEILSVADSAMYLAKSRGRNCVALAQEIVNANGSVVQMPVKKQKKSATMK